MFDYLSKTYVINFKEFYVDKINDLVGELGIESEIAITDGGELNFDKSFLRLNEGKKYIQKLLSI